MENTIIYEVVYMDKDGNFHDTNIEYKSKELGVEGVDLKIGNCKELDMDYIQLYESEYNSDDERVKTTLIYEKKI